MQSAKEEFQAARVQRPTITLLALANSRLDGVKAASRTCAQGEQTQASRVADEATWCELPERIAGAQGARPSTSEEFEQFDVRGTAFGSDRGARQKLKARLAVRTAEERIAATTNREQKDLRTASAEREARAQSTRSGGRTATTGEDRHRGPCCCGWRREPILRL